MNAVLLALLIAGLLGIQVLIGGTRLVFSLPCYGLIAAAAVLSLFVRPASGMKKAWPTVLSLAVLAGYVLVRARFSPVDYLWWPDFYEMLACLLVYGLVAFYLGSTRSLTWLFAALLLLAVAEAAIGFRQFARGDEFMLLGLSRPPNGHRASGFFVSPNNLAGYLEVLGVFALSFACWSNWRGWLRGVMFYLALVCYGALAVTGSRGGYLSVALSLIVFAFLSVSAVGWVDRNRAMLVGLAGAVVLILGSVGALQAMSQSQLLNARLQSLNAQFNGQQIDWRIYNWQAAGHQFRLAPLTGTGAGTYLYYARFFRGPKIQMDLVHAHCDYLEMAAEYGVLGLGAMLFFIAVHLVRGWLGFRRMVVETTTHTLFFRHDDLALQIGALSAIAAYLLHSAVDFNLHIPGNALLLAALFGVLGRPGDGAVSAPGPRFSPGRLVLPALGLWMLLEGMPKIPGEYRAEQMRKALVRKQYSAVVAMGERIEPAERNWEVYFYQGEANRALASASSIRALRPPLFNRAAEDFRHALTRFPQDAVTWLRLAQTLDGLRLFPEAEKAYLTALKLDPQLAIFHAWYAAHLRLRGREDEARAELKTAETLAGRRLDDVAGQTLDAPPGIGTRP